jgi:hypothetical protein
MIVTIHPDGQVEYIGTLPIDLPLENPVKRRVSHIIPVRWHKRIAFRILRMIFGESGKAAAWTRRWTGPWLAIIIATHQTKTFNTRAEAITWELSILNPDL